MEEMEEEIQPRPELFYNSGYSGTIRSDVILATNAWEVLDWEGDRQSRQVPHHIRQALPKLREYFSARDKYGVLCPDGVGGAEL